MRGRLIISLAALGALATPAWAGELVTLRNGFAMHCDHHASVESHVRLYLSAGENDYIDFLPQEAPAWEHVAAPPPTIIANEPANDAAAPTPEAAEEAKLSPADLHEMLAKAGGEHNLDVDLLASLVKAESGGNARAVSRAGARGLMQLMPGTATELGVNDSFRPDQNVRGGSAYLDALLTRYNNK